MERRYSQSSKAIVHGMRDASQTLAGSTISLLEIDVLTVVFPF